MFGVLDKAKDLVGGAIDGIKNGVEAAASGDFQGALGSVASVASNVASVASIATPMGAASMLLSEVGGDKFGGLLQAGLGAMNGNPGALLQEGLGLAQDATGLPLGAVASLATGGGEGLLEAGLELASDAAGIPIDDLVGLVAGGGLDANPLALLGGLATMSGSGGVAGMTGGFMGGEGGLASILSDA